MHCFSLDLFQFWRRDSFQTYFLIIKYSINEYLIVFFILDLILFFIVNLKFICFSGIVSTQVESPNYLHAFWDYFFFVKRPYPYEGHSSSIVSQRAFFIGIYARIYRQVRLFDTIVKTIFFFSKAQKFSELNWIF